jgi:cell division protein FtsB
LTVACPALAASPPRVWFACAQAGFAGLGFRLLPRRSRGARNLGAGVRRAGRDGGGVESRCVPPARKKGRRAARAALARRWAAVGALLLVALLYYRPLKAYVDARGELATHSAAVQKLKADKTRLEHQVRGSTSLARLAREARALGYVRPGERLYIVKGIPEWRKRERASIMAHRGR